MSDLTQKQVVFNHVIKYGSISRNEAIGLYRITRLAAVIFEMAKDGLEFSREGPKRKDYRYTPKNSELLAEIRDLRTAKELTEKHGYRFSFR